LRASQVFQHGYQVKQLVVVRVREPAANGHGMLRMENVRGGRVVNDDRLAQVTPNLREILSGKTKKKAQKIEKSAISVSREYEEYI
jgi:hypothetical protein